MVTIIAKYISKRKQDKNIIVIINLFVCFILNYALLARSGRLLKRSTLIIIESAIRCRNLKDKYFFPIMFFGHFPGDIYYNNYYHTLILVMK